MLTKRENFKQIYNIVLILTERDNFPDNGVQRARKYGGSARLFNVLTKYRK